MTPRVGQFVATRDLTLEIRAYLHEHGPATAREIARGITARTVDVLDALHTLCACDAVSGPRTREDRRMVYLDRPSVPYRSHTAGRASRPRAVRPGSDCDRLYGVLSDGRWHSSAELHDLYITVHSRISDLRLLHGCTIEMERVPGQTRARAYRYRLVDSPLVAGPEPSDGAPVGGRAAGASVAGPATSGGPLSEEDPRGNRVTAVSPGGRWGAPEPPSSSLSGQLTLGGVA